MLLVQKYLRSGKSLDDLRNDHGVKTNETNGKVCFNYDQLEAKESDPLSQQCRGLVLRKDTWEVVACPLFRFFNMEQKELASDIHWESAAYEEKMDGSCLIVYYDHADRAWHCGTRGRCEADANAHDSGLTFRQLFDTTVSKLPTIVSNNSDDIPDINSLMVGCDKNKTYVFELTTPLNRIVCRYDEFNLTLLAVRCNETFNELNPSDHLSDLHPFKISTPERYKFNNINHMIQVVRDLNPEFNEGVVVKDKFHNRIKVKSPAYLSFNHMRDSLSTSLRGCVEVILLGKEDDVIHMMPDVIANRINTLKPVIAQVLKQAEDDYNRIKHITDQKSFALEAQKCFWTAPMFALKNGKTENIKEFSLGNKPDQSKLPKPAIENMLQLCKKLDPTIEDLL